MTNITIINPRTAWKSDSGIFYTICLIFILYRLIRYSSAPSQRPNLREWNETSPGVSSLNVVFTSLPEPEAANRLTSSNLTISIDGLMYFFIIFFFKVRIPIDHIKKALLLLQNNLFAILDYNTLVTLIHKLTCKIIHWCIVASSLILYRSDTGSRTRLIS